MEYAIRIQALSGYDKIIEELLSGDRFSRTIRVHHTGKKKDNSHYHLLITCDYKHQAIRAEFKKHFILARGNKHLSIKVWDGDIKAVAYLFHEGTEPDLIKNFTPDEIALASVINSQIQMKIKKNSPAQIIQDCTDYFINKGDFEPHRVEVFQYVFLRLKLNGDFLPNKFQYDRWAMRIQANVRSGKEYQGYMKTIFGEWYGATSDKDFWDVRISEQEMLEILDNQSGDKKIQK